MAKKHNVNLRERHMRKDKSRKVGNPNFKKGKEVEVSGS